MNVLNGFCLFEGIVARFVDMIIFINLFLVHEVTFLKTIPVLQ